MLATETGEDTVGFVPWREDLFVARDSIHYLAFRRNDEGEVHRLVAGVVNQYPCPAHDGFDYDVQRPEDWTSSPAGSNRREYIPHPTVEELTEFEGVYVSPELSTSYAVVLEEDRLVLRHKRHGTLPIIHAYRDEFKGTEWYTRAVNFRRNQAGEITGLVIDLGSRTRNLVFRKVDPASQAYVPG